MICTLSYTHLRKLFSIKDIDDTPIPTTGAKNFKHTPFILLPPFIGNIILSEDIGHPDQLLLTCNYLIEQFDIEHNEDPKYDKAIDHCQNIVTYLWAASKNLIPLLHSFQDTMTVKLKGGMNNIIQLMLISLT